MQEKDKRTLLGQEIHEKLHTDKAGLPWFPTLHVLRRACEEIRRID
jgi:hypothetical protein